VRTGVINNETLGYYMARTQLFLNLSGVRPHRLRFRQPQANEMAHYAVACWDAEIHTSYGWVECVGHADRSCYDLSQHTKVSGVELQAWEDFKDGPHMIDAVDLDIKMGLIGKNFRASAKHIHDHLKKVAEDVVSAVNFQNKLVADGHVDLVINGETFKITPDLVSFTKTQKKVSGQTYIPHVIEPSFGLGRIIYALLEHNYYVREGDEQRAVLSLPAVIAPVKVSVLPLLQKDDFTPFVQRISHSLKEHGLSNKVDETGQSIGRRYARTDEIGIPFGITIDFDTLKDDTVTLRERDTTKQIRIPIKEVAPVLRRLCDALTTWEQVLTSFPLFTAKE